MSDNNKKILVKRIITTVTFVLLFTIVIINFMKNASSSTDENFFDEPPSRYYLVKSINAIETSDNIQSSITTLNDVFILDVDGKKLKDTTDLSELLKAYKPHDDVEITIFEPQTKIKKKYYVKAQELQKGKVKYLNSAALVLEVFEGGASDRAGMKAGDIIIQINGKNFSNVFEADKILTNARSGEVVKYIILRKGKILELNLIPVRYGVSFIVIFQNFVGLLFLIFGFYIVYKRPNIKPALLLGYGLMFFGTLLNLSAVRPGLFSSINFFNAVRYLVLLFTLYFGITLLMISTYYFPIKVKSADRKWLVKGFFVLAGILFLLDVLNRFVINSYYLGLISLNAVLLLLIIFIIFRIIYRKEYSKEYKKINRPIFYLFTIFIITRISLRFVIVVSPELFLLLNYFLICLSLFILIAYYYVIAKEHLLDLNIRIKRNIQYSLISIFWQLIAFILLILIIYGISKIKIVFPNIHIENKNLEILNKPLDAKTQEFYSKIFLVSISVIITVFWLKFKSKIQKILAKRFHRTSFDYRKTASELSRVLAHNFSIEGFTKNFAVELAELMYLKRAGILVFKDEETVVASDFYNVNNEQLSELLISSGGKLIESLKMYSDSFTIDSLPAPHNQILKDFGFRYLQPIKSKNKLLGLILVGEKKSETSFNSEDFEFLSNISGQISVAIENSFLYENLTKQERMKHELEIARKIQLASLPDTIPNISGLDISGISIPALEVGGDFYDFLETDNNDFMVIIGDVSGKGTSAALYMSKIQGVMRALFEFRLSPRKLLIRTNNLLSRYLEKGYFISATSINFNTQIKKANVARAGHLPLYLYKKQIDKIEVIKTNGMVLGLAFDNTFDRNLEEREISYSTGDIFILVTDGVTESKNSLKKEFGEENLIQVIDKNKNKTASEIRDAIINSAKTFAESESQYDDMTVVIVKII